MSKFKRIPCPRCKKPTVVLLTMWDDTIKCPSCKYPFIPSSSEKVVMYYIFDGSEQKGPYTISQLRSMWGAGSITAEYFYWTEDMKEWSSLASLVPKLNDKEVDAGMAELIDEQKKSNSNVMVIRLVLGFILLMFLLNGGFRNCSL